MDFELTRNENDVSLLPQIEAIRSAENIHVLIPFAKAYLGMFYVIDNELAETEKVKLLANPELAEAIFDGFINSIQLAAKLATVEEIGTAAAKKEEYGEGYVILAGLDMLVKKSIENIKQVDKALLEKAIAFYFSNQTVYKHIWFDYLLAQDKDLVKVALEKYWVAMLKNNATFLPGRALVLGSDPDVVISRHCILPLLSNWKNCKAKTLLPLLQLAFQYCDADKLLAVCEEVLSESEKLTEKIRLYWLAAAYLVSPDKYFAYLSDYVGRVKLKIMPLLDFVTLMLRNNADASIKMEIKTIVQLLRMIAPVFPPQHHVYGTLGQLDINSKNVMLMFYHLACSDDTNVVNEIKSLRKARVMKIYADVIDHLLSLIMHKNNSDNFSFPDFNEYIEELMEKNCLHGRSNKFDLR